MKNIILKIIFLFQFLFFIFGAPSELSQLYAQENTASFYNKWCDCFDNGHYMSYYKTKKGVIFNIKVEKKNTKLYVRDFSWKNCKLCSRKRPNYKDVELTCDPSKFEEGKVFTRCGLGATWRSVVEGTLDKLVFKPSSDDYTRFGENAELTLLPEAEFRRFAAELENNPDLTIKSYKDKRIIAKKKAEEAEKERKKQEEIAKKKAEEAEKERKKQEEIAKKKAEEAEKERKKQEEIVKKKAEEAEAAEAALKKQEEEIVKKKAEEAEKERKKQEKIAKIQREKKEEEEAERLRKKAEEMAHWSGIELKLFLEDMSNFVKANPKELEALQLIKLLRPVKQLTQKSKLTTEDFNQINSLEEFLMSNNAFSSYRKRQLEDREIERVRVLDLAKSNLKNILNDIMEKILENPLSDESILLAEAYEEGNKIISSEKIELLEETISIMKKQLAGEKPLKQATKEETEKEETEQSIEEQASTGQTEQSIEEQASTEQTEIKDSKQVDQEQTVEEVATKETSEEGDVFSLMEDEENNTPEENTSADTSSSDDYQDVAEDSSKGLIADSLKKVASLDQDMPTKDRLSTYAKIFNNIDNLITNHSATDEAIKILSNQNIGNFDPLALRENYITELTDYYDIVCETSPSYICLGFVSLKDGLEQCKSATNEEQLMTAHSNIKNATQVFLGQASNNKSFATLGLNTYRSCIGLSSFKKTAWAVDYLNSGLIDLLIQFNKTNLVRAMVENMTTDYFKVDGVLKLYRALDKPFTEELMEKLANKARKSAVLFRILKEAIKRGNMQVPGNYGFGWEIEAREDNSLRPSPEERVIFGCNINTVRNIALSIKEYIDLLQVHVELQPNRYSDKYGDKGSSFDPEWVALYHASTLDCRNLYGWYNYGTMLVVYSKLLNLNLGGDNTPTTGLSIKEAKRILEFKGTMLEGMCFGEFVYDHDKETYIHKDNPENECMMHDDLMEFLEAEKALYILTGIKYIYGKAVSNESDSSSRKEKIIKQVELKSRGANYFFQQALSQNWTKSEMLQYYLDVAVKDYEGLSELIYKKEDQMVGPMFTRSFGEPKSRYGWWAGMDGRVLAFQELVKYDKICDATNILFTEIANENAHDTICHTGMTTAGEAQDRDKLWRKHHDGYTCEELQSAKYKEVYEEAISFLINSSNVDPSKKYECGDEDLELLLN